MNSRRSNFVYYRPPTKRLTLEAPGDKEKQPEPVNKQPMNVLMQDFAKTMEHCNQLKKEMDRIQKQDTRNFMVTTEFAGKMKEICERMGALNAVMPDSVNIQPLRKRIQLIVKNCRELFTKDIFCVDSTPVELFGFKWYLQVYAKEKGFLGLYLHAKPPSDFKGNYRIEVDCRFSILNAVAVAVDKDLIRMVIGHVYTADETNNKSTGWGFPEMAKLEDLLDPNKTFLNPDGDLETWVDFTIKSSTLDHMT